MTRWFLRFAMVFALACASLGPGATLAQEIPVTVLFDGRVTGVNAYSQVVGWSSFTGTERGFLRDRDGTVHSLPALGDAQSRSSADDVNDSGLVVGVCGFSYYGYPFHACAWVDGEVVDLGAPGGGASRAHAVNAAGQIVGDNESPSSMATLWTLDAQGGTTSIALGTPGVGSGADDINDAGEVVGWSDNAGGEIHAFLWTAAAGMRDLGTLPEGRSSYAKAINALGHVVGQSYTRVGTTLQGVPIWDDKAFLWTAEGGMVDLAPEVMHGTYAQAINDRDEIVGYHYPHGHAIAFIWSAERGMVDLPDLGEGSSAWDINDDGTVVGDMVSSAAPYDRATVWYVRPPVTEPPPVTDPPPPAQPEDPPLATPAPSPGETSGGCASGPGGLLALLATASLALRRRR
jgi:probable HAF family extracellular repeat protein